MAAEFPGTYVLTRRQTEIDGIGGAALATLAVGSLWRWAGDPVCIDMPAGPLELGDPLARAELHHHARRAARRILRGIVPADGGRRPSGDAAGPEVGVGAGFSLTDGCRIWKAVLAGSDGPDPLIVFPEGLPPRGRDLFVAEVALSPAVGEGARPEPETGVICFTPGTLIATPDGPRAIEHIRPGDRIATKDNGAQPVAWTGARRITGARLHALPQLRPIRVRSGALGEDRPEGDLIVSPDHRLLLRGPRAEALFNACEVLVTARDLVDDRSVTVDHALREVTYVHLMTERHEVIWANGLETETFHPASADPELLCDEGREALFAAFCELAAEPLAYGGYARRILSRAEAAILRHDAAGAPALAAGAARLAV